jgi:hypothetical protein
MVRYLPRGSAFLRTSVVMQPEFTRVEEADIVVQLNEIQVSHYRRFNQTSQPFWRRELGRRAAGVNRH